MFPRTCFQEHVSKNLFFAYLAQRVNTQLFDIFAKEQKGVKKRSIRLTAKLLKTPCRKKQKQNIAIFPLSSTANIYGFAFGLSEDKFPYHSYGLV